MIEALLRPCRPWSLAMIGIPALAVALLYQPGPVGALVYVVALFLVVRYGFVIVAHRAQGRRHETLTDWTAFNRGFDLPLKQSAVVIVFALVHGVAVHHGGEAAGYAALLVINLAAPATVIIIGLEGGLVEALNPARIAGVIARLGFDYVAACFVLVLFSLAGNIALDILLTTEYRFLRLFLYSFCAFYYILAVFFMMGWLVERHREDLTT